MSRAGAPRPLGRRILGAFGTSILGVFSGLLTNLWLLREIVRVVPAGDFGVYALVLQVTAYLGTLQLGLDFAASRRIAERIGAHDSEGAASAYHETRRFNLRIAAPVASILVLLVSAALWVGVPGVRPESGRLAAQLALLTGSSQVIAFLSRARYAALVGAQRQVVTNLVTVAASFTTTFVAFGLLWAGAGVFAIPVATVGTAGGTALLLWYASRRACPFTRVALPPNRAVLRELTRFGGYSTANGLAWTVEATSDVFLLGWASGPAAVTSYVLWWRFPAMLFDLCTRLVGAAFPALAERHGQSKEHASALFGKVSHLSVGLASVALVGVTLWLPSFVRLWVGDGFGLRSGPLVAALMGLLLALRAVGNLLSMFWVSRGDARFTALLGIAQAIVKVAVGAALAPRFGIAGVLVASCLASVMQIGGVACALARAAVPTLGREMIGPGAVALTVGACAVAWPIEAVSVERFALGVTLTALLCGSLWLAWAWRGPLRPNLERAWSGFRGRGWRMGPE